jgi:hypothetical protein
MQQVLTAVPLLVVARTQEPLRAGRLLLVDFPRPLPRHPRTHVSMAPCA